MGKVNIRDFVFVLMRLVFCPFLFTVSGKRESLFFSLGNFPPQLVSLICGCFRALFGLSVERTTSELPVNSLEVT